MIVEIHHSTAATIFFSLVLLGFVALCVLAFRNGS